MRISSKIKVRRDSTVRSEGNGSGMLEPLVWHVQLCELKRNEDFRWCLWRNQFHERYRTRLLHSKCGHWTRPRINNVTESLVWKCISHVQNVQNHHSPVPHTWHAWWRWENQKFGMFDGDHLQTKYENQQNPIIAIALEWPKHERREKNSCNHQDECFDINWVTELTDASKSIRWQLRVGKHSTRRRNFVNKKKN